MSNTVYLQFPGLDAFIDYLKNYCNIYEVGLVVKRKNTASKEGIVRTTFYVRVTKHASSYSLILVCDTPFWSDIFYNGAEPEIQRKRDEAVKAVKAALEKGLDRVKISEAEYCLEPDL